MKPERSYLVCSTPRSGSTLVCKALRDTGVAGRPEEYFEALRSTGRPRRPEEYFAGVDDRSIFDELGEPEDGGQPPAAWSRNAYDRYLEWAMEQGTTENGVFGAKLMWQYLGDFVGLLRGIPEYRGLPLTEILPAAFPELTFVRVVRANKIRQAVSLWKAVQTASWSDRGGEQAPSEEAPYRAYLEEMKPQLRFHYRAISHLLDQILVAEANWDAFFEHTRIRPILVLYENFYADYAASTLNILDRLGLEPPPDFAPEPQMRRQSDGINDDWARRFSELRLGTEFDLVPAQGGER
ncbi:MAG TPA: Stf0 family sulfotransferase [Solirubrobacterales bacterium]|nr:Stf0 family sulfotransferase [Solirubrobacterales bacterium]